MSRSEEAAGILQKELYNQDEHLSTIKTFQFVGLVSLLLNSAVTFTYVAFVQSWHFSFLSYKTYSDISYLQ